MVESKTRVWIIAVVLLLTLGGPAAAQFPAVLSNNDFDGRNGFTVTGYVQGEFGVTVAGVGDVNGDGVDDFMTGGRGVHSYEFCWLDSTAGAAYVIFGHPGIGGNGLWSAEELDGTNGYRIPGINVGDDCGFVSAAGDFNQDGVADFLVGAPGVSPFGILVAGEAYLIYGGSEVGAGGSFDLTSLDGANGFTIRGMYWLGGIGWNMSSIGDFNDDGMPDIALGAFGADPAGSPGAGQVYVLYGGRGTGASGALRVPNDMNAEIGLIVNGASAGDGISKLARAGDFNGDGVDDLLISGSWANPDPLGRGEAYVVYGGKQIAPGPFFELADLDGTNGFAIDGPPGVIGEYIAGVGDLNADGFDDIAIGVNVPQPGDWVGVIFGGPDIAPEGRFCLEDLNGENGFRVVRGDGSEGSSSRVDSAGDLNNDGIDDLFLKIFASNIIFGSSGIGASGEIDVMQADGQDGFMLFAGRRDRGYAGDINADGIDDAFVGDEYEDNPACDSDIGAVHIVFGRRMGDGDLDADIDLADLGRFQVCFGQPPNGDVPDACHPFDFDKDNDIDLNDCAEFETLFGTAP